MDENKVSESPVVGEARPEKEDAPAPEVLDGLSEDGPETPEKGPETGEEIHWATKKERIIAWVLAVIVILITLAYAYSIATGDLFRR